jgi:regulator of protease activity HflC (stomatin/prohibitin superfamily)
MVDNRKFYSASGTTEGQTRQTPSLGSLSMLALLPFVFLFLVVGGSLWWWYGWRIEPENGEFAILIKKTGKNLAADQIIAPSLDYKGVQLEVLPEGRFFYNPYVWDWKIMQTIDIPAGKFGVLVRKFGKNLPGGAIIAQDDTHKGIVRDVIGTGKHRINPYAYEVKIFNDIKIAPGHVGVVTALCGKDILSQDDKEPKISKNFLVLTGEKGVQSEVLKEGTHRLNPYLKAVSIVNIQSQRFELSGADAIIFLTLDGFPITVEGTLEFNLNVTKVAQLTHEVGDMADIMKKLILPNARGFSRLEGSKKNATDFIVGTTRQDFQNNLEKHLQGVCKPWGISINSVLVRDIIVPQQIASVIRDRELAAQEAKMIEQQTVQAVSQGELGKQKALAEQNRLTVSADTEKIRQTISAQQKQMEKTIAAQTELEVAKISLQTAKADAESLLKIAESERKVVEAQNKATADVLRQQVTVYKSEADYIRAKLYEKTAPRVESVLTTDNGGGLFGLPLQSAPKVKGEAMKKEVTP